MTCNMSGAAARTGKDRKKKRIRTYKILGEGREDHINPRVTSCERKNNVNRAVQCIVDVLYGGLRVLGNVYYY